jgi:hypothetical protein
MGKENRVSEEGSSCKTHRRVQEPKTKLRGHEIDVGKHIIKLEEACDRMGEEFTTIGGAKESTFTCQYS